MCMCNRPAKFWIINGANSTWQIGSKNECHCVMKFLNWKWKMNSLFISVKIMRNLAKCSMRLCSKLLPCQIWSFWRDWLRLDCRSPWSTLPLQPTQHFTGQRLSDLQRYNLKSQKHLMIKILHHLEHTKSELINICSRQEIFSSKFWPPFCPLQTWWDQAFSQQPVSCHLA